MYYHSLKSVRFFALGTRQGAITPDCKNLVDSTTKGPDHIIINIPCFYAQSFIGIKSSPGVRGLETRKV